MKPITFSCEQPLVLAPEDIARQILDLTKWSDFHGYGPIPGIKVAEFDVQTPGIVGSRSWTTWNDGTLVELAQAVYQEKVFDRLPILADALEAAGCTNEEILAHCRGPGPHVRGCWVVDLILGKQ